MFLFRNSHFLWGRFWWTLGATAAVVAAGVAGADEFLWPYFQMIKSPLWNWLHVFGSWKILTAASFAAFVCARVFKWVSGKRIFIEKLSANVFCSIILAESAVWIIKVCVGRARWPGTGFDPFTFDKAWHSFPSGHTAAAFATLVSIGLRYPKIKAFTWGLAILAGLGRACYDAPYMGHYFGDAVAGAFIGMLAADLIVLARRRITAMTA